MDKTGFLLISTPENAIFKGLFDKSAFFVAESFLYSLPAILEDSAAPGTSKWKSEERRCSTEVKIRTFDKVIIPHTMRTLKLILILPLIFLLQACPIGLDYSMAEGNQTKIDKKLIGVWTSDNPESEIVRVEFTRLSETSLRAKVLEPGESYTVEGYDWTVWQTEVEGRQFLVFKPDNENKYYHYCFEFDGDQVVFHDVSLLDGGTDAVTSVETLREEVAKSINMDGWGSEKTRLTRD